MTFSTGIHVLVVMNNEDARVESLALALALGTVNAGAEIRLRTLSGSAETMLHAGYIAPRPVDVAWADLIVAGAGADGREEMDEFCSMVTAEEVNVAEVDTAQVDTAQVAHADAHPATPLPMVRQAEVIQFLLEEFGSSWRRRTTRGLENAGRPADPGSIAGATADTMLGEVLTRLPLSTAEFQARGTRLARFVASHRRAQDG